MTTPQWVRKLCSSLAFAITSTQDIAADQVTFQLDWLPGGDKAPVYVGIHEGFFCRAGYCSKNLLRDEGLLMPSVNWLPAPPISARPTWVALMMAKANDQVPVTAVSLCFQ